MPRKTSRRTRAVAVIEPHAPVVPLRKRQLSFGGKWPYAPAPEAVVVAPQARYELFIGGKFVAPKAGGYFPSLNPAN